jgi:hypothetical protein
MMASQGGAGQPPGLPSSQGSCLGESSPLRNLLPLGRMLGGVGHGAGYLDQPDGLIPSATPWAAETPKVSIDTRSQRFSQGMEVKVSCSATGYPAPHISWSREGLALQEDSR